MKITPRTPDIALPLAEFIRAHYVPARSWPHEALLKWVRWNLGEEFLAYVIGEDGETIVGVGIARPVMRPDDGASDCKNDPEGPCVFVDLAVTVAPAAWLCLFGLMRQRFGFREQIAYRRRGGERITSHPYLRLHRKVFTAQRPQQTEEALLLRQAEQIINQ